MGVYNTYGTVQLKVDSNENLLLRNFKVGDKVNISDGVYVGYEGVVVIYKGKFVKEFSNIYNKWGNKIRLDEIISGYNPINPDMIVLEEAVDLVLNRIEELKQLPLFLNIKNKILEKKIEDRLKEEKL